jgi:HD-like signal output (HDOD) protein
MRLLALLADENCSLPNLAACIATDPIFSARVLKRANAADVAGYMPTCDIPQALVVLGLERTRQLTLTIATVAYLGKALREEHLRRCWRHMVACGLASSTIAKASGLPPAEAYTAGLIHDIGRLGLITAYRDEYVRAMEKAREEGLDLLELERERFGVDHTEAGEWLAAQWNLPESLAKIARCHHEEPSEELDVLAIVQIGCRLADLLGFSVSERPVTHSFDDITAALPAPARIRLRGLLDALTAEIQDQIAFFEGESNRLPVRPIAVRIEEEEEQDFLRDFPSPDSPALLPRSHSKRYIPLIAAAVMGLLGVLLLLCRCSFHALR